MRKSIPWIIGILFIPILYDYFSVLWGMEYYRLYPLLLLTIGFIFWRKWTEAPSVERVPRAWVVKLFVISGLLLLGVAYLYYTPWLASMAAVIMLGGGALILSGLRDMKGLFSLWCLIAICVRLPFQMGLRSLNAMETWTAEAASAILDYYKVMHTVQGNVFALPDYNILLDKLLSGPVSLFCFVGMAACIAAYNSRKILHCILLICSSILVAWVVNIVRLIFVVIMRENYDLEMMSSGGIWLVSAMSFILGFLFLYGNDRLIYFLLKQIPQKHEEIVGSKSKKNYAAVFWNRITDFSVSNRFSPFLLRSEPSNGIRKNVIYDVVLVLILLFLIPFSAVITYYDVSLTKEGVMHGEPGLSKMSQESILFDRPGWDLVSYREEKRDFKSIWGSYSNTWVLKYNQIPITFSFDYPFDEWHDVRACYINIGWKSYDEQIIKDATVFAWPVSQTKMRLPNGDYGFILCSNCGHLGNPLPPKPTRHGTNMFLYKFSPDQWAAPFGKTLDKNQNTYYQTQAMVATTYPLDEATMQEIRLMYADFREQTRRALERLSRQ